MMHSFRGKRALITGAAAGIGRAIAIELAKLGCHTCLIDINAAALKQVVHEVQRLGVDTLGLPCDVGEKDAITYMLNRVLDSWPEIDILVNNAGVTYRGRSAEMDGEDFERLLAVNSLGPIRICQQLLPMLLSRPEAHVLNVCSVMGLCGFPKFSAYCTSKFALVGYSESLRAEYSGSRLGVTAVCPGFVRTAFIESMPTASGACYEPSVPAWLCTTPDMVARKSVKAIRRNQGLVLITPLAHLTWRLKRFAPGFLELPRLWRGRHIPTSNVCGVGDRDLDQKAA